MRRMVVFRLHRAEIHNVLNGGLFQRQQGVLRGLPFLFQQVIIFGHRVNQIHQHLRAFKGGSQRFTLIHIGETAADVRPFLLL
ncbi:hypothetical protein D3C80_1866470 [compost metagenome]